MTHRHLRLSAIALTGFIALAGILSACAGSPQQNARQAVAASATLFATARIGFTAYANLPRCTTPPTVKPCSDPAKVVTIGGDMLVAHDTIDLARQLVNQLPSTTTVAQLPPEGQKLLEQAAQAAGSAQVAVSALK